MATSACSSRAPARTVGGAGLTTANFGSGIYHDQFVLEKGVWRFWNLSLDEPYINPIGWKRRLGQGQGSSTATAGRRRASAQRARSLPSSDFKPDVPVTALGKRQEHFRGGTGETWRWPDDPADVVRIYQPGDRPHAPVVPG